MAFVSFLFSCSILLPPFYLFTCENKLLSSTHIRSEKILNSFSKSFAFPIGILKGGATMPAKKTNPTNEAEPMPSGAMIRNYPKTLCHEHISGLDNHKFYAVSFKFMNDWASFIIGEDDVQQATRRNGDIISDCVNILLGDPDDVRHVSVSANDGEGYINQPMFNRTICSSIAANRKNYLRSIAV